MTDYTEADIVEAFQRGYGAARYRGKVNDIDKLNEISKQLAAGLCDRWLDQKD